ncbi:mutagen-sensitive 312 [Anticarsia gemmatalis]|uniref:mutagen-sensitive 312 n=1 Tax=Anticarsia gemmatalis TaxID=129554 RepID=UPI003F767562
MSIDSNSQCVRSKYFAGKTDMDESLSDFKETKQNCKGPKTTQKAVKPKARKPTKRIKGQKDIRTALKGKKNELVSYTKEFDTVCKKSGLDVDSEQLQLAIALSKSLQSETCDDASTSQTPSTQGRIARIRKTLQEYGFKVPENKVTVPKKKVRRSRKHYKLLNTCEEERHQKISSKYSQVLFGCLSHSQESKQITDQEVDTPIYNIGTNLQYEYMRDNNIFYIENLVEKSTTSGCMLRDWSDIPGRPVSPVLFETSTMNISEIKCSQDELDIILSGPIKSAKSVIASKKVEHESRQVINTIPMIEVDDCKENENTTNFDKQSIPIIQEKLDLTIPTSPNKEYNMDEPELVNAESNSTLSVREQYRSVSPDIFDDEVSCVMETSKPILSQGQKTKLFTEDTNYMDLTECANVLSQNSVKSVAISQNVTKRRSDDFMEMTECAVTASQGIKEDVKEIDLTQSPEENSVILGKKYNNVDPNLNFIPESPDNSFSQNDNEIIIAGQKSNEDLEHEDIDLTHSNKEITIRENSQDVYKATDFSKDSSDLHIHRPNQNEFDLTQSSSEENEKSVIIGSHKAKTSNNDSVDCVDGNELSIVSNLLDPKNHVATRNDIDLTQSSNEDTDNPSSLKNNTIPKETESMDLTQLSKSSIDTDELPAVNIGNTQLSQSNADDTIILNEEEYLGANGKVKKSTAVQDDQVFDLTQANKESPESSSNKSYVACSSSFYDEYIHNHSDSKENSSSIEPCVDGYSAHNTSKESIDLAESDCSVEDCVSPRPVTAVEIPNNSSLGKKDDVSIDYDEICEYNSNKDTTKESCGTVTDKESIKYDSSKSQVCNDNDLVSSQTSEVFDLTDKELDYSLHQSRFEVPLDNYNYDFGGISVVDNDSSVRSFMRSLDQRNSVLPKNDTLGDSYLPEVNFKKNEEKVEIVETDVNKPNAFSPNKVVSAGESAVPIVTPKNSEYIVKTDEVTPMMDYASMTTPQRNKELDKYGLKPFKRKRAIQILTHLYNQTHPIVESYSEDDQIQPSPSKKPRQDTNLPTQSNQLLNPGKHQPSNFTSPNKVKIVGSVISPGKSKGRSKNTKSPRKDVGADSSKENAVWAYEVSSNVPVIRSVDCSPDDWVFQKREKAKVHSCRVPLHIAFHNYVLSRRNLREAILKYEPVNIDVIHKDLVSYGHRYDPKDLLRFLDKKCITVKTTDNNARNKR